MQLYFEKIRAIEYRSTYRTRRLFMQPRFCVYQLPVLALALRLQLLVSRGGECVVNDAFRLDERVEPHSILILRNI